MIDLGFGDPVLIRKRLNQIYSIPAQGLGYRMGDDCEKEIIAWVKSYYKDNFHIDYRNVILTHGANGGLHVTLKALKGNYDYFYTHELAFGWYKKITDMERILNIKVKDLRKVSQDTCSVYIIDSPSNPWGYQIINNNIDERNVIWDSVYASSIFIDPVIMTAPKHHVMVGSFSKMFGLSGLRIGWVATNDDILASRIKENALTSYCGLSTPSLEIASNLVENIDLVGFNKIAKLHLDFNREEMNKLRNIFNMESPEYGMFYLGYLDDKNSKILEKSGVRGIELEGSDKTKYIRFNMADDEAKTKNAIKAILKADSV
jgi:aspartate/methionine/tyrosine aminotransferase